MFTLACLAGIAVCVLYRRQAPKPLTVAALALAVWLAISVFEQVATQVIWGALASRQQGGLLVSNATSVLGFFTGIGRAGALAGLVWAVLSERNIDLHKPGL